MHKLSLVSFRIGRLLELLLVRHTPTTKHEVLSKGVGVAKFDFTKTFRNQLFSHVRVLYH